jgi:hypothetical protein
LDLDSSEEPELQKKRTRREYNNNGKGLKKILPIWKLLEQNIINPISQTDEEQRKIRKIMNDCLATLYCYDLLQIDE